MVTDYFLVKKQSSVYKMNDAFIFSHFLYDN